MATSKISLTPKFPGQYGEQRDLAWRGWQTRYTYVQPENPRSHPIPIILLHGFGASLGHWRHNLFVLGQFHPVYALDLVGFGATEKPQAPYDAYFWARQVHDFWQTIVQKPAILVGNSIGSLIALTTALTYPEVAAGLVLISVPDPAVRQEMIPAWCAPVVNWVEGLVAAPWLLKTIFYWVRRPGIIQAWAGIAYGDKSAVDQELVEILLNPAFDRGAAAAFVQIIKSMTSPNFGPKVKPSLAQLDIPTLILWGEQDRMIPPQFASQFAACNPQISLKMLPQAGHCPQDEQPELVNQEILAWIESSVRQNTLK
ncbi:alpha/beta fold hydrolase [Synechococcus sp. PCC 6312]|uniref:alpha/beta fold hydrolase n=1 Tax=Synechococcus sp. (strain ATCC 27167 / PCC 6312) TaxID=195253 RepID=UPI00029F2FCB|nr:alpha/beta fold hydrolase [Synechococcus sp. PCC 6312]AFY59810.1 putative hydrolase or acyltransferase of alpha/beta superfamily [Synechococcus sp. PCC 6312]